MVSLSRIEWFLVVEYKWDLVWALMRLHFYLLTAFILLNIRWFFGVLLSGINITTLCRNESLEHACMNPITYLHSKVFMVNFVFTNRISKSSMLE